uniref:Lipoprotein-releasing ABC transporter permease subunit LolE n=1 Tax=Candidatus Aschnera chinzeii TaxID=1485666 RepID=A0AAT9G4T0_9ENTR|nr:MAG: lipoprotein-releasing ABC transporter permease subunit LolE [Candidatus Aschnera chinzeii]
MVELLWAIKIALRFNQGKKGTILVSIISLISVCSIILGVAILIICLSAINGFEYEFKNRILSVIPHGQINAVNPPYLNWQNDFIKIKKSHDISSVSPYVTCTAILEKNNILQTIHIVGIDLKYESMLNLLPKFVLNDRWQKLKSGNNEIIIGNGIAQKLKISIGDYINIMLPHYNNKLNMTYSTEINFLITGIIKLNGILDNQLAIIPLQDAQYYLSYGDGITGFKINVKNIFNVNKIIYDATINLNNFTTINTWIDDYGYVYNDIQTVRCIMYLTMIMLIAISCFNIVFTLMISVNNKRKYIAILKTMGAKNSFIGSIFIWYGVIIGFIGSLIGLFIGVLISFHLSSIIRYIENIIKHQILSTNVYFIDFIPSKIHIADILYVVIITIVLSLLASWYPAKIAININPIDILKERK